MAVSIRLLRRSFAISCALLACGAGAQEFSGHFNTPLFGLASLPNGEILAADAGQGLVSFRNNPRLVVPLPGVTDVAPIVGRTFWATRSSGATPMPNAGQALYRVQKGKATLVANLWEFEEKYNPHPASVDSNPFDVESLSWYEALVADAAGNDLLKVNGRGRVDVLAVFPDEMVSTANLKSLVGCPNSNAEFCSLPPMMPAQPVPTSIAIGLDNHYYVGELKGFPAPAGASNIWRVAPWASWAECGTSPDCELVFAGGFTSIIDLAFDVNGTLYVTEFDEQSWFAPEVLGTGAGGTINACDVYTKSCTVVAGGIPMVTAIAFGKQGALWATRSSLVPGAASVFRVQ